MFLQAIQLTQGPMMAIFQSVRAIPLLPHSSQVCTSFSQSLHQHLQKSVQIFLQSNHFVQWQEQLHRWLVMQDLS